MVARAIDAVEHTASGNRVDLVGHGAHGRPAAYLHGALREAFGDVAIEYVERCGRGGHVTRVRAEGLTDSATVTGADARHRRRRVPRFDHPATL